MPLFSSKFAYKKSPVRRLSTNKSDTRNSHKGEDENDNNNEECEEETDSSADSNNEDNKTDGGGAADSEVKQIIKTHKKRPNRTKQNDKTSLALNSKLKKEKNLKGKKSSNDPLSKSKTTASKPDSNVILYLDKSQGLCFEFQPKQGSWQEISGQKWKQQQQSNLLQSSMTNSHNSKSTEIVSNHSPDLVLKSQLTELADRNKVLEEENRLLKLKVEILMEMVTETTAELNLKNKCDN